ncbi:hypothetical protein LCU29_00900 [Escherichia coli]|nr:hypothetical protein [Escherichia coli]
MPALPKGHETHHHALMLDIFCDTACNLHCTRQHIYLLCFSSPYPLSLPADAGEMLCGAAPGAYLPVAVDAAAIHCTTKHSSYAPLPLSLSPPGVRRMVYCRAVRLTESQLLRWLTSLSCRCFVSMG